MARFVQLLKQWLCNMQSGIVAEKDWALGNQRLLQVLPFSGHFINTPSILLSNGFAGIQKVVVPQTGSRPPNSESASRPVIIIAQNKRR